MQTVGIIGLGLIGGSIGLALKQNRGKASAQTSYALIGYDSDPRRRSQAEQMQAVDQTSEHLADAVRDSHIIIIATPVLSIRQILAELAPLARAGAMITDTASTKTVVLRWAQEMLPPTVHFIGGHPMAGSTGSLEEAQPDLFRGSTYCLVPTLHADKGTHTDEPALQTLQGIIAVLGARSLLIDAETHDRCVSAISHLPFFISIALIETIAGSADIDMMSRLASSGFRDTTRLAGGDPAMYQSIALTNRNAITAWIDTYIEQLQAIRQTLQTAQNDEGEHLLGLFRQARDHRKKIWDSRETYERQTDS
jgi:prephenate dehydrogenase